MGIVRLFKKNNTALTLPVKSWNCLFRHCLFSLSSNVNWWSQKALWTEVNRQPHERGSHLWSGQAPLTWSHHITILVEKNVWACFKVLIHSPGLQIAGFWTNARGTTYNLWYFSAIWGSFRFSQFSFNMADDCFQTYAIVKHSIVSIGRPLNLFGWDSFDQLLLLSSF